MENNHIEDLEKLYEQFNNTEAIYPKGKTIIELFVEQVARTPHGVAVLHKGQSITYKELDVKSNQVASLLKSKNIGKKDIVGIAAERSFEMVIGIYGILKSGAAYLPISPDSPLKRIEYVVVDSEMSCLLTQNKFLGKLASLNSDVIDLNEESIYSLPETSLNIEMDSNDLMYVIYTSGSTGQPKGVMVEHYSVVNRLNWMQKKYPISEKDTILQKTPFVFDVSVWELFWWGITGARVSMLEAGYEKFPQAIIKEIQQCDITTMHFVPSMMNVFLNYIENSEDAQKMKALKQVFCSGEALLPAHANKFNKLIGLKNSIDLINLYGPTEATVDVTSYDCPKHTEINVIPIGKPIDNIKLYVLKDGELQPPGSEGELCIAGDGLARGYLHKADLTAEKFVENHDVLGQRVYKTGDYVRMSSDQNIEYIGRVDNQIKIRGLRIELGEIESKVSEYETVEQCVVVVKNYGSLNPTFAAYMLSKDEVDVKGIKEFLKTQLPSYMIPNKYITLTEFPLTGNGKIDRKALTEN